LRAPVDTIPAPPFLPHLRWVNVKSLRMDRLRGRPVLIEFWDFCRPNSLRTLPYLKAWHERYEPHGLQVVGIHSPGFAASRERGAVEAAVARLGITYPVLLDPDLEMWQEYENRGWPARYLFDGRGMLFHYHYGEGAYVETERAIQELLGVEREPLPPLRPENARGVPTPGDVFGVPPPAGGVAPPPHTYRAWVGASSVSSQLSSSRRRTGGPSSSTSTQLPGQ
jgi:thiol-disulfide isomerase/thioredoxin